MTQEERAELQKAFEELDNLVYFHNKNLTNAQYTTLAQVRNTLRELVQKAEKKGA